MVSGIRGVIGDYSSQTFWKDTSCAATTVDQKKVAAICQKDGMCPDYWTPFNDNCYLIVHQHLTWDEAEKICNSRGGHLASIHSADENDFIYNLLGNPDEALWLGASDADVEVKTRMCTYYINIRFAQLIAMYCIYHRVQIMK